MPGRKPMTGRCRPQCTPSGDSDSQMVLSPRPPASGRCSASHPFSLGFGNSTQFLFSGWKMTPFRSKRTKFRVVARAVTMPQLETATYVTPYSPPPRGVMRGSSNP